MKVLLLFPKIRQGALWYSEEGRVLFFRRPGYLPPLGLMTVASYLPAEFELRLFDRNVEEESAADWQWCDVVFISLMFAQQETDYKNVLRKARSHGKLVAVGGAHTSAVARTLADEADWVCLGEAENVMDQLVRDITQGAHPRRYTGGGNANMGTARTPRFDLLRHPNSYCMMGVQCTRGCPFSCEFCDIPSLHGHIPRNKRTAQVLEELSAIKRAGFRGTIFFVDDNFIGNKIYSRKLLADLIVWNESQGYPFIYYTQMTLNAADDSALLADLSKAQFQGCFFGLESGDLKILETTKKKVSGNRPVFERLKRARQGGIHPVVGLILGFDGETREVFQAQERLIELGGLGIVTLNLLRAFPNTGLYTRLKAEGRLLEKEQTIAELNFVPKGAMTKREYLTGYVDLLSRLYDPTKFFPRIVPALLSIRKRIPLRARISRWWGFPALFIEMYVLGVKARRGRRSYWRALCTIALKNPCALENFVLDTAYFYDLNRSTAGIREAIEQYLLNPKPGDVLDAVIGNEGEHSRTASL